MADVFFQPECRKLLDKKSIVFFGDSNMRAIYKDLLLLLSNNSLISSDALRSKLERSFCGDTLIKGNILTNGRHFVEERQFNGKCYAPNVRFYFITRCYSEYVDATIKDIVRQASPDLIVFNSCLWDITRWGANGVQEYKSNLLKLMKLLHSVLPKTCMFVWCTTLPVSKRIKGGFLIQQVEFLKHSLRFQIAEANLYASNIVSENGFDVLDVHFYLRYQIHRRADDGIHWFPHPTRHVTNLLLTHVALAWNHALPGRFFSRALNSIIDMDNERENRKATTTVNTLSIMKHESVQQLMPPPPPPPPPRVEPAGRGYPIPTLPVRQRHDSQFVIYSNSSSSPRGKWRSPPYFQQPNNKRSIRGSWQMGSTPNYGYNSGRGRGPVGCHGDQPSFYMDFTSDTLPTETFEPFFTATSMQMTPPPPPPPPPTHHNHFNAFRTSEEKRFQHRGYGGRGNRSRGRPYFKQRHPKRGRPPGRPRYANKNY